MYVILHVISFTTCIYIYILISVKSIVCICEPGQAWLVALTKMSWTRPVQGDMPWTKAHERRPWGALNQPAVEVMRLKTNEILQ